MVSDRETPDRPLQNHPGARGLYASGTLMRTLGQRNQAEPEHARHLCLELGGSPEPQAPDRREPRPDPWLPPGLRRQPRPGRKKTRLEPPKLGVLWRCPLGAALPATPPPRTRSRTGHDTRRQTPLRPPGARGLPGHASAPQAGLLRHQESFRRRLGQAGSSRQSLTRSVLEQSSRTTSRASLAPRHHLGP
jgi:hypothetical protein